jgi:outer membrane beta-barrel protein
MRATALSLAALLAFAPLPALAADEGGGDKKAAEKEAEDASKAGRASLADKIAPVSGNLFSKAGRFEISPAVGLSLDDAFFQKYSFGLKLNYHILESFSVGLYGSYSLSTVASAVNVCKTDATGVQTCNTPQMDDLKNVPGKVGLLAGIDLAWSPIYGKVNILAEKVLHFDTTIFIGGSLIQYQEPGGDMTFTGGFHFGLGERIFFTPSIALRVEVRDYLYSAKIPQLGDATSKLENQLMLELGVSFFVGGGS